MWRAYTPQGFLAYSFIETVSAKHIENVIRLVGGLLFLSGTLVMCYNLVRTARLPGRAAAALPLAPALAVA
jgi:cytochrome c oxidase cbb3-type subunit 1